MTKGLSWFLWQISLCQYHLVSADLLVMTSRGELGISLGFRDASSSNKIHLHIVSHMPVGMSVFPATHISEWIKVPILSNNTGENLILCGIENETSLTTINYNEFFLISDISIFFLGQNIYCKTSHKMFLKHSPTHLFIQQILIYKINSNHLLRAYYVPSTVLRALPYHLDSSKTTM